MCKKCDELVAAVTPKPLEDRELMLMAVAVRLQSQRDNTDGTWFKEANLLRSAFRVAGMVGGVEASDQTRAAIEAYNLEEPPEGLTVEEREVQLYLSQE